MDGSNDTEPVLDTVLDFVVTQGISIIIGIVILLVGWWAIGIVRRWFAGRIERSKHVDPIVGGFLASLLYYGLLTLLVIIVLNLLGVQTTSLIAVLGAASLAVGLALQGSLTALAAGVMIVLLRPIRVGDYIEVSGEAGTVKTITLFFTELATYDNIQKMLPNSAVWGNTITNYSVYQTRLLDIEVGIDYGDPIDTALEVLQRIAEAHAKVMDEPAPAAFVSGMGESSVDLTLRIWVAASDYWPLKRELTKTAKEEIEKAGLSIPFPHRQLIVPPEARFPPKNEAA
ncbi:MAG: mechanosensitive ion channel [Acuticoccus sp.]